LFAKPTYLTYTGNRSRRGTEAESDIAVCVLDAQAPRLLSERPLASRKIFRTVWAFRVAIGRRFRTEFVGGIGDRGKWRRLILYSGGKDITKITNPMSLSGQHCFSATSLCTPRERLGKKRPAATTIRPEEANGKGPSAQRVSYLLLNIKLNGQKGRREDLGE